MKKLLLFLLMLPLVFGACSKVDEESLNGTTWDLYENKDGVITNITLSFSETTYYVLGFEEYSGGRYEFSSSGTYTYNHPDVTFTADGDTYKGKISGNKLTVYGDEGSETYTKK